MCACRSQLREAECCAISAVTLRAAWASFHFTWFWRALSTGDAHASVHQYASSLKSISSPETKSQISSVGVELARGLKTIVMREKWGGGSTFPQLGSFYGNTDPAFF